MGEAADTEGGPGVNRKPSPPEEEISFRLPGGPGVRIRGREVLFVAIIVLQAAAVVWLANFSLNSWGKPFDLKKHFQAHDDEMIVQHRNYVNGVTELTYVMSVCLNQQRKRECEELRIAMPESLYGRMRH